MIYRLLYISVLCCLWQSCTFGFKGISIDPNTETFLVDEFRNIAANAPANLGINFAEELRTEILDNTSLSFNELDPDIELIGTMTRYEVQSVAPQENDDRVSSALNRLIITTKIQYIDNQNEDNDWEQSFSAQQDFESTENLSDVQDQLIEDIFDQLTQDIFNKAFTNW